MQWPAKSGDHPYDLGVPGKGKKEEEEVAPSDDVDLSRVCAGLDYHINGADPLIRDDSEYPDWLWEIAEPVKSHKELPQDSELYQRRLNKYNARNNNSIRKQSGL